MVSLVHGRAHKIEFRIKINKNYYKKTNMADKTIIATGPSYLLLIFSVGILYVAERENANATYAALSVLLSTDFISVMFCCIFSLIAFESRNISDKLIRELVVSLLVSFFCFIFIKIAAPQISKNYTIEDFRAAKFSYTIAIFSILSFIYTVFVFKRTCKNEQES